MGARQQPDRREWVVQQRRQQRVEAVRVRVRVVIWLVQLQARAPESRSTPGASCPDERLDVPQREGHVEPVSGGLYIVTENTLSGCRAMVRCLNVALRGVGIGGGGIEVSLCRRRRYGRFNNGDDYLAIGSSINETKHNRLGGTS